MRSASHRGSFFISYCFIVTLCNICLESSSPPPARHISLLLNSHRSSDSHHYTFPKSSSYHPSFVIVPSGSMQISSARATPYQRARRAVRARAPHQTSTRANKYVFTAIQISTHPPTPNQRARCHTIAPPSTPACAVCTCACTFPTSTYPYALSPHVLL